MTAGGILPSGRTGGRICKIYFKKHLIFFVHLCIISRQSSRVYGELSELVEGARLEIV